MSLRSFFERRVRGVRLIELWAGALTLVLALGVYLAKTGAGDEGADIARTQAQIVKEQRQIRLLKAEVADNPRARSAKLRAGVRTAAPAWRAAA